MVDVRWPDRPALHAVDVAAAEPAIAPDVPESSEVLVDPAVSTPVCEAPAPPEGVLTAEEATQRTRDLMVAVGLDPEAFTLEPYADEWFASVGAVEQLDGAFNGRRFDAGFGAGGVLQYASGQLAVPARVGPYPLVDVDTAVARLNDPSGYYGGGMIALDTAVARDAVSEPAVEPPVAVDMPEASVDPVVAESTPPAPSEPAPDAGSGVDPAAPPVSDAPVEPPGARAVHGHARRCPVRRVVGVGRRRLGVAVAGLPVHR